MKINVREFLGDKIHVEDAIILIISKINVKNLSNYTDYSRVVAGTTFA